MKWARLPRALALALCWCVASTALPVAAQGPAGEPLRVISWSTRTILLEWKSTALEIETLERGGETCQRLTLPGTVPGGVPGAPQVPVRGALLGVPPAARAGVSVEVVEAEAEWQHLDHLLCPAPTLRLEGEPGTSSDVSVVESALPDPRFYGQDAFYPRQPVAIGTTGYLRDQAVVQVQFAPVAYNPARGEVRLYRRVLVRVTWETPEQGVPLPEAATQRWSSPAFEGLLRATLLNYETLKRPPPQPSPVPTTGEGAGASPPRVGGTEEGQPALKIGVTEDGLYRLTYGQITAAGFDVSGLDPRTFQLAYRGTALPIRVQGEQDGTFDPGDAILFYGTALKDVYGRVKIYWLTAGPGTGIRLGTREGSPLGDAPVPPYSPTTLHAEQDTVYWSTMPNGEGQEHWFWGEKLTAPESRVYTFTLSQLAATPLTATLRVQLKGRTDLPAAPDHHTRLALNGTQVDDLWWDGFENYEHQVVVSRSLLREGENVLLVEGVAEPKVVVDQFYLNWIEVDYGAPFVAEGGALFFSAPGAGRWQFRLAGFDQPEVDVYDVTNPAQVVRIENPRVVVDGAGYALTFEDQAGLGSRYLAVAPSGFKAPDRVELDRPSNWRSPGHGADAILITSRRFWESAQRLAAHRRQQGLRAVVVDVQDLYDEFSGGMLSPVAIRDFLAYAYHEWQSPAPTCVTLLGGATYDYRDLHGLYRQNDVPAYLIEAEDVGQVPSDNWLVAVHGDDVLPDMLIGRLPAQSPEQARQMVDKIVRYETEPPGGAWYSAALLVADDDEPSFEQNAQETLDRLPFDYAARQVYLTHYPPGDPRADILGAIEDGVVLVQYHGHASAHRWGILKGEPILAAEDIGTLDNQGKLPFVSVGACLNGHFTGQTPCMAELFMREEDRGAIAVWAGSAYGYAARHRVLMNALYEAIYQDDLLLLGAATTAARVAAYAQNAYWGEMIETYVFFGDPATPLAIPANAPYVIQTVPDDGARGVPVDQELMIRFSKPMSPATVLLTHSQALPLPFTPAWSSDHREVRYVHPGLEYGQALTLTVSGQDRLGRALRPGPVPSTWSFGTEPAIRIERVAIDGPVQGTIHTAYAFEAALHPSTATLPVHYLWQVTGQPTWTCHDDRQRGITATWSLSGLYAVTVTATNPAGLATTTRFVTIQDAQTTGLVLYLPLVIGP